MKKRILALLCSAVLILPLLTGCSQEKAATTNTPEKNTAEQPEEPEEPELTHVTLNEVAHSIFYAPMYVCAGLAQTKQ